MIKAGDLVTVPAGLPGYTGRSATVLKTDSDQALIEWTEEDGSRTATWEPFKRLVVQPAPDPPPATAGEKETNA